MNCAGRRDFHQHAALIPLGDPFTDSVATDTVVGIKTGVRRYSTARDVHPVAETGQTVIMMSPRISISLNGDNTLINIRSDYERTDNFTIMLSMIAHGREG